MLVYNSLDLYISLHINQRGPKSTETFFFYFDGGRWEVEGGWWMVDGVPLFGSSNLLKIGSVVVQDK